MEIFNNRNRFLEVCKSNFKGILLVIENDKLIGQVQYDGDDFILGNSLSNYTYDIGHYRLEDFYNAIMKEHPKAEFRPIAYGSVFV